ncbi:hypothetical protein GF323_05685 [Candidatus Woesearchaeota archaeon]|nr:hypothetical protein [Candidatus Woesearchaeota archaeon]
MIFIMKYDGISYGQKYDSMATLQAVDLSSMYDDIAQAMISLMMDQRTEKRPVMVAILNDGLLMQRRITHHMSKRKVYVDPEKYLDGVAINTRNLCTTLYRDDDGQGQKKVEPSSLTEDDVEGADIYLVDTVMKTGRTARAAMEHIFDMGRAATVRYFTLMYIPSREKPVQPNYSAAYIGFSPSDSIKISEGEKADGFLDKIVYAEDLSS